MRIRLHETPCAHSSVSRLIDALDIDIVERRSTLPGEEVAPANHVLPPDVILWDFSDDPEVSARELRFLLGDPDLHRIPTLVTIPSTQLGLEMSAVRGGCEAVIHSPVTLTGLAGTLSTVVVPQAMPLLTRTDRPTTLLSLADESTAAAVLESLREDGHVVYAVPGRDAVRAAERIGFDLAILDADASACRATLCAIQPDVGLVLVGGPQTDEDGGTRLPPEATPAAVAVAWQEELRKRRDQQHSRALADQIAARQRELQRVNQTLRRVNRAFHETNTRLEIQGNRKDEMIGIAAHELKSPLAAMGGALDILCARASRFEEDDRRLLWLVHRNNKRMIKLVSDILDLARLDAGAIMPRFESRTLPALVDQAVATVAVPARGRGIRFDVDVADPQRQVDVDAERLVQMLINLLDNAVKFSPPDGIVRVTVRYVRRRVHFVISDTGPGIPENERDLVFERFHHNSRGAVHAAGSGLGLTITLALARLHGGSVTIGEGSEGGAQFTVTLPVSRDGETR